MRRTTQWMNRFTAAAENDEMKTRRKHIIPTILAAMTLLGLGPAQAQTVFTADGTFTPPSDGLVKVMLVGGGGGGGGAIGAGGGGGEVLVVENYRVSSGVGCAVVVGAGGSGGADLTDGTAGIASTFDGALTAAGGGKGGGNQGDGGTSGNGFAGGTISAASNPFYSNAGGGGASGVGIDGSLVGAPPYKGGNGGPGLTTASVWGSVVGGAPANVGGGGGGGTWYNSGGAVPDYDPSLASDGGGAGGYPITGATVQPIAGTANTGGGGGGGCGQIGSPAGERVGADGGSGLVIVEFTAGNLLESGDVGTLGVNSIFAFKSPDRLESTGSWTVPVGVTEVEIMLVSGGGAGGYGVVGGGGGGFVQYVAAHTVVPGTSYDITIGAGGIALAGNDAFVSSSNTVFGFGTPAALTAAGGTAGALSPTRKGGNSGYNATPYTGGLFGGGRGGGGAGAGGAGGAGSGGAPGGTAGLGLNLTDVSLFGAGFAPSGTFIPAGVGGGGAGGGSALGEDNLSGTSNGHGGGDSIALYKATSGINGTGGGGGDGGAAGGTLGSGGSGIIVIKYNTGAVPPTITSDGAGDTAVLNVSENTTAVTDVNASVGDEPLASPPFALTGDDAGFFTFDTSSGVLAFTTAPDFETPLSLSGDNNYEVTVTVSDTTAGTPLTDEQDITITVDDTHEVLESGDVGSGSTVINAFKSPDRDTAIGSWTAPAGVTSIKVMLAGGGGAGQWGAAGGGGGGFVQYVAAHTVVPGISYDLTIGEGEFAPNANTARVSGGNTVFGFGTPAVLTAAGGTGGDFDPNPRKGGNSGYNATPYTGGAWNGSNRGGGGAGAGGAGGIAGGAGGLAGLGLAITDASLFGATFAPSGAFIPAGVGGGGAGGVPSGENNLSGTANGHGGGDGLSNYNATSGVDGTGGGGGDGGVFGTEGHGGSGIIVISYEAPSGAPAITSNGGGPTASINVNEGTTAVTTVLATAGDEPLATPPFSLSGADAGLFTFETSSGVLAFTTAPDREDPQDANTDNDYEVTVTVTDTTAGTALTDTQDITITVDNVAEPWGGVFANAEVQVNTTLVGTLESVPGDNTSVSYAKEGTAFDEALFTIGGADLSFLVAPTVVGAEYFANVKATGSPNGDTKTMLIKVTVVSGAVNATIFIFN
jgi:hypothetical protein